MIARDRIVRLALAAMLAAGGYAIYKARKAIIQTLFERGASGGPAPELPAGSGAAPTLAAVTRTRVALLDGVDADTAHRLAAYDRICRDGLDLTVDVGFPTVSLPVQSVLWTGLTQQQSGVQYVGKQIAPPLAGLPGKRPSVAVAENYQYIVHSLGFTRALPESPTFPGDTAKTGWIDGGFETAAHDAVVGGMPLAFVHILGPDTAGHKHGRDSRAFRHAADHADHQLAALVSAAPPGADTRWFVLADHGHRAAGGHGGEEPEIRLVRACIAGAGVPRGSRPATIHLVDLSRAIADSLGVAPDTHSAGRPLASALSAPSSVGATLPSPGAGRWLLAIAIVALAVAAAVFAGQRKWWAIPWWLPVAYVAVVAIEGWPTLSNPMVYKPLGKDMWMAAMPGLLPFAIAAGLGAIRASAARATIALALPPLALAIAALILCWGDPPLMPRWTAHASLFLVLAFSACGVVALAHLASAARRASGRATPPETSRSAP